MAALELISNFAHLNHSQSILLIFLLAYHHNVDGWLPVSDTPMTTELSKAVLSAAEELGYFVGDLNTMTHTGFMEVQTTTLNGARFAADSAFLYSQKLPNLHVRTYSHVSKVSVQFTLLQNGIELLIFTLEFFVPISVLYFMFC